MALVTGAESADGEVIGLGRAAALMLAREGAKVVATDIAPRESGSVVDEIRGAGGEAIFVRHDVSVESDWLAAIDATLGAFGRLDILVNMAGLSQDGSIEDAELEDWRRLMAVNLDGVFLGTKHGVRAMKESGGGPSDCSTPCPRSARVVCSAGDGHARASSLLVADAPGAGADAR